MCSRSKDFSCTALGLGIFNRLGRTGICFEDFGYSAKTVEALRFDFVTVSEETKAVTIGQVLTFADIILAIDRYLNIQKLI